MSVPVTPVRVDALLLDPLRERFPDYTFGTLRRHDRPRVEVTMADSMQGMSTPISQYARLRVSVRCAGDGSAGGWDKAARAWADVAREIIRLGRTAPLIDASLESGPVRMVDDDGTQAYAYGVLLLEVAVG